MGNFIGAYKNAASADFCERMIARLEQLVSTSSGDMGQNSYGHNKRKDVSRYFERDDTALTVETNSILDAALKKYIDEYPALGMAEFYSQVVKVQKTPPKGGFHIWHSEQGAKNQNSARCLVWMIYLNTTPDGEGATEFLEQGVKLQPEQGTVVFFPAAWTHTHRGNPVYTCDKYIATGWYYLAGE
jgi:hypothetical protein